MYISYVGPFGCDADCSSSKSLWRCCSCWIRLGKDNEIRNFSSLCVSSISDVKKRRSKWMLSCQDCSTGDCTAEKMPNKHAKAGHAFHSWGNFLDLWLRLRRAMMNSGLFNICLPSVCLSFSVLLQALWSVKICILLAMWGHFGLSSHIQRRSRSGSGSVGDG